MPTPATIIAIATICHEANRAYCRTQGDRSQRQWEQAPEWQQTSALDGVCAIKDGLISSPEQSHESWMSQKLADGWKYGEVKDAAKKEHPSLRPYGELTQAERVKDALFFAIATTLLKEMP